MRKFAMISQEELREKVEKKFTDEDGDFDIRALVEHFKKELKVTFDLENWAIEPYDRENREPTEAKTLGLVSLENGLTFWGMYGGGDWESPVVFIIYWDGSRLRAYTPKEGNGWNTDTYEAYGNDEEKDFINIKKRWPEESKDLELEDTYHWVDVIEEEILKDIIGHFELRK